MVCHDDDLALRKSAVELLTIHLSRFSLHIYMYFIYKREEKNPPRDMGRKGGGREFYE